MTWNVQNGGAFDRLPTSQDIVINNIKAIIKEIEKNNVDILIIQEFQYRFFDQFINNGLKKMGYFYIQYQDELKNCEARNGVLIASKIEFIVSSNLPNISEYSKRNWNEIVIPNNKIHILGVDVPLPQNDDLSERETFFKELEKYFDKYKNADVAAVVIGDLNVYEGATLDYYKSKFDSLWHDIGSQENTWRNHKLDYIYGNDIFFNLVKNGDDIKPIETDYSDHAYLIVEI